MRAIRHGLGLLLALILCVAAVPARGAIGPTLLQRAADATEPLDLIILLETSTPQTAASKAGRPSAYALNRQSLQTGNEQTVRTFLAAANAAGIQLGDVRSFWLAPFVSARVNAADLARLQELPGVGSIIENGAVQLVRPQEIAGASAAVDATAAGQEVVSVHSAWERGLTGRGTLVASIDTGVDGDHPALKDRYRGLRAGSEAAWFDPVGSEFPNDFVGHGTHTIGTVVGRETADTVGIAPDAEWIAAGVVDRGATFSQTVVDLVAAFEWLADPDGNPNTRSDIPDAVINSWGIPKGVLPSCDNTFWQVVDNLEALGAVVVFAAGNEGPNPSTLRTPADRNVPLKCFSVGAVDATDTYSGAMAFSSRGPVTCDDQVIKPEIVAPGVHVRSCQPGGGYRLLTGTSMAAPHVAGAILLLRQYNPDATPEEIKQALVASATDLNDPGPDQISGYGLLNISRAIDFMPVPKPVKWEWNAPVLRPTDDPQIDLGYAPFQLVLQNRGRSFEEVTVDLTPVNADDRLTGVSAFGLDYLAADVGLITMPVSIVAVSDRAGGERIWLDVRIRAHFPEIDSTVRLGIQAGALPPMETMAQPSGKLSTVASNFGRFDGAATPDAPVFRLDDRDIAFAGGIRMITATRDVSAIAEQMPFEPSPDGDLVSGQGALLSSTAFRDTRQVDPVGVEFTQVVYAAAAGPGEYVLYDYTWSRIFATQPELRFGAWFNWDLSAEVVVLEAVPDAVCILADGLYLGAVWLDGVALQTTSEFVPTASLPPPGSGAQATSAPSLLLTLTGESTLDAEGRFGVAIVVADNLADWLAARDRARAQYSGEAGSSDPLVPTAFNLGPTYPNPFNPATTLQYSLERDADVRLDIFNVLGQQVRTLVHGRQAAGDYRVRFDGLSDQGVPLPSGVYHIRLAALEDIRTGKMTLLR